jgi:predicted porin
MRILGFCTLLAFSTSVLAENFSIYGQAQAHLSTERAKTRGQVEVREAVGDEGTFIGFKGFKPLNHNLDVTYMNETALHFKKGHNDINTFTHQKQHWVGLRSVYGEWRVGKQYMPNKVLVHEMNQFKDQYGAATALINPDTSVSDSVLYIQSLGNTEVALGVGRDRKGWLSPAKQNHKVLGGLINYKTAQGLVFSAGVEKKPSTYVDSRLSINYQKQSNQLGVLFQQLDTKSEQILGQDSKALLVNASHTQGKTTLKAQIGRKEDKSSASTQLGAIGVDHQVDKKLRLYAEHSVMRDKDGSAQLGVGARLQGAHVQATSVGLVYSF